MTDPASLRIEVYPAECLRRRARPAGSDDDLARVAARMIELMHAAEGIGLAAPQVALPLRLFVCHVPPGDAGSPAEPAAQPPASNDAPEVFINPEILDASGPHQGYDEGCLSLPGITGEVVRPTVIRLRALALDGTPFERTASGLLARCWLHEIDHLDGVLITDRMTDASRRRSLPALRQLARRAL